jgi:chaperone required for assembly of F1-ATPase
MKRFYKDVSIAQQEDGWSILLDNRPVRTPSGQALLPQTKALALAIAKEWDDQQDTINPASMHLLQLQNTLQDRLADAQDGWRDDLLSYLETDLLAYHAPEPEALAARQQQIWMPWLDWLANKGLTKLPITTGFTAIKVPGDVAAYIEQRAREASPAQLLIWRHAAGLTGSSVLSLALIDGACSGADAYHATRVEEQFYSDIANEDLHGKAPHQQKSDDSLLAELTACAEFCRLAIDG